MYIKKVWKWHQKSRGFESRRGSFFYYFHFIFLKLLLQVKHVELSEEYVIMNWSFKILIFAFLFSVLDLRCKNITLGIISRLLTFRKAETFWSYHHTILWQFPVIALYNGTTKFKPFTCLSTNDSNLDQCNALLSTLIKGQSFVVLSYEYDSTYENITI